MWFVLLIDRVVSGADIRYEALKAESQKLNKVTRGYYEIRCIFEESEICKNYQFFFS